MNSFISAIHPQIARQLRREILNRAGGHDSQKLPSNQHLAARFGVSHITIRKALATLAKEDLIEVRSNRGTFISKAAMRKAGLWLTNVGMVVLNVFRHLEHPYFRKLAEGLAETLNPENGYNLQLLTIPETGRARQAGILRVYEMIANGTIDGIVLSGTMNEQENRGLLARKVPIVRIGLCGPEDIPTVLPDAFGAAEMIAEEVLRRHCRWVCLIRNYYNPYEVQTGKDPTEFLLRKLSEAGVTARERDVFAAPSDVTTEAMGYQAAARLLEANSNIDCMIVSGHNLTLGARAYLEETGRLPGKEFTLIAKTDDEDLGCFPTIALPVTELGREAGRVLKEQFEGHKQTQVRSQCVPFRWLKK